MGEGAPRILAVTGNASLVMGLTFLPREWDVLSQSPDATGPLDGDVVVLDLGTTSAGLHCAQRVSPDSHAVIIGTEEPDAPPPSGVLVLLRPYTVEELAEQIERLLSTGDAERAQDHVPTRSTDGLEHRAVQTEPDVVATADPAEGMSVPDGGTDRQRRSDRQERRRSLPARLFGRVAPDSTPQAPDDAELLTQSPRSEGREDTQERVDGRQGSDPAPSAPSRSLAPGPPPPPPVAASSPIPADTSISERRTVRATEVRDEDKGVASRPMRWRSRRGKAAPERERQLRQRLTSVLAATSELEQLVREVPLLVDPPALGAAIVREVAHALEADSIGLWRQAEHGWYAVAHRGLTRNEASWVVPPDQPLFAEVDATGGALLLDPVDAVQAAVVGIGGAHTESFMAAAIAVGPGRYGILAVGRDRRLVEDDLDTLADLAFEMAPGLAVAQQIEWLRDVSASHEAAGDQE